MNPMVARQCAIVVLALCSVVGLFRPDGALAGLTECERSLAGSALSKEHLDAVALIDEEKASEAVPLLAEAFRKEPHDACLVGRYLNASLLGSL